MIRELTDKPTEYNAKIVSKWLAKALQYNLPKGEDNYGLLPALIFKTLADKNQLTPDNIRRAHYLGWCVETILTTIFIVDDIMDNSLTRYGQVCWHRVDGVGMSSINDAFMIENATYVIIKNHFRHTDYYSDLIDLVREGNFMIISGQSLDLLTANEDVASFTMEKFQSIGANKIAGTFYYPFALGMHMAGIKDADMFTQVKMILLQMGQFAHVKNDFVDCFGNPEDTGKIGTDIQCNKCTWLATVCLQEANDDQKKTLTECYGRNDPDKIARVKQLYLELGLPSKYAAYEKESYNMTKKLIQQTSSHFQQILMYLFNTLYH